MDASLGDWATQGVCSLDYERHAYKSGGFNVQPDPSPMTQSSGREAAPSDIVAEPLLTAPTDADIDEWAARERKRRAAWLEGPSLEQKAAWARRERERRLAELAEAPSTRTRADRLLLRQRYLREAQLASEGAMSLFWKLSMRGLAILVREGREWEEEFAPPRRRRRVRMDNEDPS